MIPLWIALLTSENIITNRFVQIRYSYMNLLMFKVFCNHFDSWGIKVTRLPSCMFSMGTSLSCVITGFSLVGRTGESPIAICFPPSRPCPTQNRVFPSGGDPPWALCPPTKSKNYPPPPSLLIDITTTFFLIFSIFAWQNLIWQAQQVYGCKLYCLIEILKQQQLRSLK